MKRDKRKNYLGECEVGDIIQGSIYKCKLSVTKVTYDKYLFANLYHCKYIEGRRKGEHEEVYDFYDYVKVT